MRRFQEEAKSQLGHYVYMLLKPGEQHSMPFYVGKGQGDRVFDHLRCALKPENGTAVDETSVKYEVIRSLQKEGREVEHVIVRHGLATAEEALTVESAIIDVLSHCGHDLTNLMKGYKSLEKGLMTVDEINRLYNAPLLKSLPDDCVIININRQYKRGATPKDIYEATRKTWRIAESKLLGPNGEILRKYVLSEYRGLIVEVFEVTRWRRYPRPYQASTKKAGESYMGFGFEGEVAPEEIRQKYINTSVSWAKKQGAAQPVIFKLSPPKKR
jgi:uncharacterized protein